MIKFSFLNVFKSRRTVPTSTSMKPGAPPQKVFTTTVASNGKVYHSVRDPRTGRWKKV